MGLRQSLMFLMIAIFVQLMWWLYETRQYVMFIALGGAVALGEIGNLIRRGRTMSADFVDALM